MSARRARAWLALGAAAGLALAALELLRVEGAGLPSGAVAVVNGTPIRRETWERALAGLAADRRNPVGPEERRHALDRLVDEELLVQRGLELGLARLDRRVRSNLVHAVIDAVLADASGYAPSAPEVEAFYAENADYFAAPGRLHVRQVLVRSDGDRSDRDALDRAREATARVRAGETIPAVAGELGDPELPPLPDGPLPPAKLREYLGPTALRAVLALEPGGVSEPVRSNAGWHVLQLVAREPRRTPSLPEIEDEVRAEMRRRAGDRALRDYLDALRRDADVRVADPLP